MSIAILTDTGMDLSPELIQANDIHQLPSWVHLGVQLYKNLPVEEVLEKIQQGEKFTTQPPNEFEVRNLLRDLLNNYNQVLVLTLSNALYDVYETVSRVAADFNGLVTVVDTRTVSIAQGMQVLRASEMAANGSTLPEILTELQRIRNTGQVMLVMKSLQYMRNNGQLSGTQALLGKVLGINPVIHVKDGKVLPLEQPRGFNNALKRMQQRAIKYGQEHPNSRIAFGYSRGSEQEFQTLRSNLLSSGLFVDMGNHPFGTSIVTGTGPGALGVYVDSGQ